MRLYLKLPKNFRNLSCYFQQMCDNILIMIDKMKIDLIDRKILREIQQDGSRSFSDIADKINLSTNACWRRIKQLQASGIIKKTVAILDQTALGIGLTAFVQIRTNQHSDKWFAEFSNAVCKIKEVTEFHRLSGDYDYLLKVVVADISDYDRIYKKIISTTALHDVTTYFSMEKIKETTELPV
jgi:Lrp/AsnC family transcriptional regulator